MPYEYNPGSARFDIPNPHRIENVFLGACVAFCFVAAIGMLIEARGIFAHHDVIRFAKCIVSAGSLLGLAIAYALLLMRQMRFFFGRGQPADLVPSLPAGEEGYRVGGDSDRQIPDAAALRQTLQQNAISYRVPRGPLDNLLYAIVRDLVYSPRLTQRRAQSQFRNLLVLAFLLILFPISLAGIHNGAAIGWIGCFYFVLTSAVVLRPLATGRLATARFSESTVVVFIAAAIVAPVAFASFVPPNSYPLGRLFDVVPITFLVLIVALTITALVFAAGIANTIKPTQIAIAPHLETPSVSTAPAQIYTELARELQRLWQEQVPNRTYMRILPDTRARQGPFSAHVIEETQPLPVDAEPMTFARALAMPTTRWLTVVDIVCALLTLSGCALLTAGSAAPAAYTTITAGAALLVCAAFGIRSANEFWRRFEFTSRIYWIDWNGNYSRAATKAGALLRDRVHTEREIIAVESMTLRVWVADIDSVTFNTDRDRDLIAIRGLPDEAERICRLLATFAQSQGTVTVPSAAIDRERLAGLNAINAGLAESAVLGDVPTAAMPALVNDFDPNAARDKPFCTTCGVKTTNAEAAYWGSCGARLA